MTTEPSLRGDLRFGSPETALDAVLWDPSKDLAPGSVRFEYTPEEPSLYRRIDLCAGKAAGAVKGEVLSMVRAEAASDKSGTGETRLTLYCRRTEARLFYKTPEVWRSLALDREIAAFDRKTDPYPIPNAMGLALGVITADGRMIFSRRSKNRLIRPGGYDCSVVETLKIAGRRRDGSRYDIRSADYLLREAARAYREEICGVEEDPAVRLRGLVFDKKYGQWNFVGSVTSALSSEEIRRAHFLREDPVEDNEMEFVPLRDGSGSLSPSPLEERLRFFLREGMWDMALAAVWAGLLAAGFTERQIADMTERIAGLQQKGPSEREASL